MIATSAQAPAVGGTDLTRETVQDTIPRTPFDEVYRRHADQVYRFCLSQLGNAALAEDVAADVFASAFAAYPAASLDGEASVKSWIFRIARNATVDQYRRRARGRVLFDRLTRRAEVGGDIESEAAVRADLRSVLAAVATLGRRDQNLVGLRIAAGLSFTDIAAVMGMSETAAKMATHRALQRVRARVGGSAATTTEGTS